MPFEVDERHIGLQQPISSALSALASCPFALVLLCSNRESSAQVSDLVRAFAPCLCVARLHLVGHAPLDRVPPDAQFRYSWVVYGAPHPLNANQMLPKTGVPMGVARSETDVPIARPGG